jgi:hypothetical protein
MGTEEFWVPVALAALSGGAQYANQSKANSRQNAAETQNIIDQQQLQSQANSQVNALTKQIQQNSPAQIAGQATGDYVSQLRKNAAGSTQGGSTTGGPTTYGASTSALAPNVIGSSRYQADKGTSQQQVEDYGNQYASEMGNLDAAVRQRQNEGLSMNTLATNLNTLNQQSWGKNFVNQLRAQAAGNANPWVSLFAGALGAGAKSYSPNSTPQAAVNPFLMNAGGGYNYGGVPLDAGNEDPTQAPGVAYG